MEDTRIWPTKLTKLSSHDSLRVKHQTHGLYGSGPNPLCMLQLLVGIFLGVLRVV